MAGAKSPTTVPPFDQVSVAVAPGDDLVVRLPGILLVVAVEAVDAPAPRPARSWAAGARRRHRPGPGHARRPTSASASWSPCAGGCPPPAAGPRARRLHDELRTWLPTVSDLPSFAVAAATEEGLAVALVGEGAAEVPDLGLRLTSGDGEQKLPDGKPFLDRLVDWPPAALRLSAGGQVTTTPHPLADLESGSVPGRPPSCRRPRHPRPPRRWTPRRRR